MLRTDSERAGQQAVVIIQVGKDKGRHPGDLPSILQIPQRESSLPYQLETFGTRYILTAYSLAPKVSPNEPA